MWNLLKTRCLKVIAFWSSLLRDELWMYKSDNDGFFSTTVVHVQTLDYSHICYSCYSFTVSYAWMWFLKLRITDHMDVVDIMLLIHIIKD